MTQGLGRVSQGLTDGTECACSLQRQNQYARDEHEQAWQDAYGNAPPFQQKWGVGVKVQPQRRWACRAYDGGVDELILVTSRLISSAFSACSCSFAHKTGLELW